MASPLAWFRRNQKGMLIVFGVLLMAVFGLPSVFFNMTPGGGQDPKMAETVVKYNGGKYTRGEFRDYRYKNAEAVRFVSELQRAAIAQRGPENVRPRAPMITSISSDGSPQEADRQVMQQIVLRKKAEEIGLKVGNNAVIDYLRQIADDDDLTEKDLEQFTFNLYNGKTDFIAIREQLKRELAAQQMFGVLQQTGDMIGISTSGLPYAPSITEAWQDWLKLNRRRAASVLKFPVKDYISNVSSEPSLSEMREIFAEGEFDFPDPSHEKPGFKLRRRVKLVMFTTRFDDFLANAENAIENEAVQDLYDQMVEAKDNMVMEIVPKEETEGDNENADDPSPEFNLDGEDAASDADSDGEGETAAEQSKDGSEEPAASEDGDDDDGLPPSGPSARVQEEQDETKQEETKQEETKQEEANQEEAKQEEAKQEEATQEPTESEEAEQTVSPDGENQQTTDSPVEVPAGPPSDGLIDGLDLQPERRVKPLDEELAKLLRRQLARAPATNAMYTAIQESSGDITDYSGDLSAFEATRENELEEREPEPDPIDLDALAREYKLVKQETELMDYAELRESEFGKLKVSIQQMFYGQQISRPVDMADYVFAKYYQMSEWVPSEPLPTFQKPDQNIVFIVEKADPKVRTFDEAKDDVIKFWKHQQAVKLAKAAAENVAEEINQSSALLMEKYPETAKAIGEFTYHTSSQLYPELAGDVGTSPDFMETAFQLEMNKAGAAADISQDNVYVVQVTGIDLRTKEVLQEEFFSEINTSKGLSRPMRTLYNVDKEAFMERYFADMEKELDIKWLGN